MLNQQMPEWLDQLITKESSAMSKQAQDEKKIKELEAKIDKAQTPEELDAIEKELKALESADGDEKADKAEKPEKADKKEDADKKPAGEAPGVAPKAPSAKPGEDDEEEDEFEGDADLGDVMKEVKGIKKDVDDKKTKLQEKLVNQLEQLNDQMGLNKIVDLGATVDQGGV